MVERGGIGTGLLRLTLLVVGVMIAASCARPTFRVFEKPVVMDDVRRELSLVYLKDRHGLELDTPVIIPRMIVLHWTAVPSVEQTFEVFDESELPPARAAISGASRLNVCSQFLVDRDGTIFQLLPDDYFARHCIGLNHCAIGVENVGGSKMPLTRAQVKANADLIRFLKSKYPLEYLIGHYEYTDFIGHPLWKETDPDYLTEKVDPGRRFMRKVRKRVEDLNLKGSPRRSDAR